jgi:hypothetical protein
MMTQNIGQELEACSMALLEALRREQPTYLEHLERRRMLLEEMAEQPLQPDPELRAKLEQVWVLGELIEAQIQRWRTTAERQRAAVAQDRVLLQGLQGLSRPHRPMFSVRA